MRNQQREMIDLYKRLTTFLSPHFQICSLHILKGRKWIKFWLRKTINEFCLSSWHIYLFLMSHGILQLCVVSTKSILSKLLGCWVTCKFSLYKWELLKTKNWIAHPCWFGCRRTRYLCFCSTSTPMTWYLCGSDILIAYETPVMLLARFTFLIQDFSRLPKRSLPG